MTVLEKKTRIERLSTEPLFFYATLRQSIEQLDSLKATFQYLLAAYEMNMDPHVRATFEQNKQASRDSQLQQLGKPALTATAEQPVLDIGQLHEQIQKTFPALRTVAPAVREQVIPIEEVTYGVQKTITGAGVASTVAKNVIPIGQASGMPPDVHTDSVPQGTRKLTMVELAGLGTVAVSNVIKVSEGPNGEAFYEVKEADIIAAEKRKQNGGITVTGDLVTESATSPLTGLSTASILEAKRIGARTKVAEAVNKLLKENDIHLTDEQLVDYMEKKISKEDLQRIAQKVERESAEGDEVTEVANRSVEQVIEPAAEFPLNQVGQTQRMVYGKQGILNRVLGPALHRYGAGPINKADGQLVECFVNQERTRLTLTNPAMDAGQYQSGIYASYSHGNGIFIILDKKDERYPWKYYVWLPQYLKTAVEAPEIFATKAPANGFDTLAAFGAEEISDITARLVSYLARWTVLARGRDVVPESVANLLQTDQPATFETYRTPPQEGKYRDLKLPADVRDYSASPQLRDIQILIYGNGGIFSTLLSPDFHCYGRGTVDVKPDMCIDTHFERSAANPEWIAGFALVNAPRTNVFHTTSNMLGVYIHAENGSRFWLPLWLNSADPMPNIYVVPVENNDDGGVYRNLDTLAPAQIDREASSLAVSLESWWTRQLN